MKNIVSAEADISDINKARREKPSGDAVDSRLPENNQGHQWKKKDSEFMQQDEILNDERSASDNAGKDSRSVEGKFTDSSKQQATVPDDFYKKDKEENKNRTMRFIDSM